MTPEESQVYRKTASVTPTPSGSNLSLLAPAGEAQGQQENACASRPKSAI
ncbi:MAG: hypothetical protein ACTHJT_16100 [Cytophaga sp.]